MFCGTNKSPANIQHQLVEGFVTLLDTLSFYDGDDGDGDDNDDDDNDDDDDDDDGDGDGDGDDDDDDDDGNEDYEQVGNTCGSMATWLSLRQRFSVGKTVEEESS